MRSLPPRDYATMPPLERPAGYICVIRDVDSDSYRIDKTAAPSGLVDDALAQREGDFGLELVTVLAVDDLAAAERQLYTEHYATLGDAWLHLDAYQLQELRASFLQLQAHASHYLSPDSAQLPRQADSRSRPQTLAAPAPREHGGANKPISLRQSISDRINDFMVHHPGAVICIILLLLFVCLVWLSQTPYCFRGYCH